MIPPGRILAESGSAGNAACALSIPPVARMPKETRRLGVPELASRTVMWSCPTRFTLGLRTGPEKGDWLTALNGPTVAGQGAARAGCLSPFLRASQLQSRSSSGDGRTASPKSSHYECNERPEPDPRPGPSLRHRAGTASGARRPSNPGLHGTGSDPAVDLSVLPDHSGHQEFGECPWT